MKIMTNMFFTFPIAKKETERKRNQQNPTRETMRRPTKYLPKAIIQIMHVIHTNSLVDRPSAIDNELFTEVYWVLKHGIHEIGKLYFLLSTKISSPYVTFCQTQQGKD